MSFLKRFFKKNNPEPEHAVIVTFHYGQPDTNELFDLSEKLETAIDRESVGEFDGHEIATDLSNGTIYMYGPDADCLYSTIEPILRTKTFMRGATVKLRYGPPEDGIRERNIENLFG